MSPTPFVSTLRPIVALGAPGILIAALIASNCSSPSLRQRTPGSGVLFLASAADLERIDLETGITTTVKAYKGVYLINELNFVARDTIVMEGCHVVKGCSINVLALSSGAESVLVGDAYHPTVDTLTQSMFFFAGRSRTETRLFISPRDRLQDRTQLIVATPQDRDPRVSRAAADPESPVVMLPGELGAVYVGPGDSLTRYNPRTRASHSLPIVNCTPILVRTRTGELLCRDLRTFAWYLVGLDGSGKREVVGARGAGAAVYAQDEDVLYLNALGKTLITERNDLFRLSLATGQRELVRKGVYFSSGIWVSKAQLEGGVRRGRSIDRGLGR